MLSLPSSKLITYLTSSQGIPKTISQCWPLSNFSTRSWLCLYLLNPLSPATTSCTPASTCAEPPAHHGGDNALADTVSFSFLFFSHFCNLTTWRFLGQVLIWPWSPHNLVRMLPLKDVSLVACYSKLIG